MKEFTYDRCRRLDPRKIFKRLFGTRSTTLIFSLIVIVRMVDEGLLARFKQKTLSGEGVSTEEALELGSELENRRVFAPAIRPPTVLEGTSRIRVSAMSTHSSEEIEDAIEAFEEAGEEMGVV